MWVTPPDGNRLGPQSQHDALADRWSGGVPGRVDCNPGRSSANAKTQHVPPRPILALGSPVALKAPPVWLPTLV